MISNRRDVIRWAGLTAVAMLAVVAVVLIVYKVNEPKNGPGVAAAPPSGSGASTKPALADAIGAKPAAGLDRDMEIQVVDAVSKQPIAGALLSINMDGMPGRMDRTEAQGRGWVILPPKDPRYVSIAAKMDGYVGQRANYDSGEIPATLRFAMERGISIGGLIKDEEGKAIAGATINFLITSGAGGGHVQIDNYDVKAKSDEQGKWRFDAAPADLSHLKLRLSHPEFISDERIDARPRPAAEELTAMSSVMVMSRGIVVSGKVMDETGKPIAGATVAQAGMQGGTDLPRVRTDAEGKFRIGNARPGTMVLSVTARGHAPQMKAFPVTRGMAEIEFRLEPGKVVKGKVVDQDGKPLGGVFVAADTFPAARGMGWATNTKDDGSFVWESAAANEVQIDLSKPGYQSLRGYRVVASGKEVLITLRRPPRVYGTVIDVESGKSIEKFRVLNGFRPNERYPITWDEREAKEAANGEYELTFGETQPMRAVRIEAVGYLPQVSRLIKADEGDVQFDVKLKKGTGPAGIVKLPDGTPAEGAELMVCTPFSQTPFRNGKIVVQAQNSAYVVKSEADGKFEFWPQAETFLIVAVHEGGFAKVSQEELEKSAEIKLAPWGRVEGKLLIASKPGAGHMIYLSHDWPHDETAPRFFAQYDVVSDKEGNFVFDRVIPGDIQMSAAMTPWNGIASSSSNILRSDATVKAGETVKVQLGGLGRPVVGRVNLPGDLASKGWTVARAAMTTKQPEPKYPQGWDDLTDEQQQEFWNKLSETAEWKKLGKQMRDYRLTIEKDGSFRIDDVLPGTYILDASIAEAPSGKAAWGQLVASVNKEITVGEIPGGKTDEPLDVGMLEATRIKSLAVGDLVPQIAGKTFDGKEFKLSDYREKHVLIEFWAARTAPAEFAKMKELYEAYGKDQRLVIVGFDFDRNIPTARQFAEANGMKWMQVFLGQKSTVAQEFGCQIWPSRWLIGPDGKVIARDIVGVRLKEEVAKAVGKVAE